MSTDTSLRTRATAALALAVALGLGALGACSTAQPSTSAAAPPAAAAAQGAGVAGAAGSSGSSDTIDLVNAAVDLPAAASAAGVADRQAARKGNHQGLRARLLRALHATWVTDSTAGPVTHQAIRGEVTAVSATSITVKAKDGVSMTFTVGADTAVRYRAVVAAGSKGTSAKSGKSGKSGTGGKATASNIGAVKVGQKALVTGVGATSPVAKAVLHRPAVAAAPKATPAPGATS